MQQQISIITYENIGNARNEIGKILREDIDRGFQLEVLLEKILNQNFKRQLRKVDEILGHAHGVIGRGVTYHVSRREELKDQKASILTI